MKKVLITLSAIAVIVLLTSFAFPQEAPPAEPACSEEPPPLPTYKELDPNPARYAGPYCAEGEECTPPAGWHEQPGYVLTDKGAEITYTDVGTLYTYLCPDKVSYRFEQEQWVNKGMPRCWVREPVAISVCS